MLFNTYEFIFLYLPITLTLYFIAGLFGRTPAKLTLSFASILFYANWNIDFVPILIVSIAANFLFGIFLIRNREKLLGKIIFPLAICANLFALGLFKYADFLIGFSNQFGASIELLQIALPIGISFFTFTQIAYLVDTWRGEVHEQNAINYFLFVSYFPHLIAGPLLHHSKIIPQFANPECSRPQYLTFASGLTLFVIGLAEKLLIADAFSPFAVELFDTGISGSSPSLEVAWVGVLAYTLQIYFDFSGYSDMAVGISKLFGIDLPYNFNAPYRSRNIIEFWRRWHMTLSEFLRDYLYIPLGGNRLGDVRRYFNLIVTMILGGLWHGANWTFLLWGGLHGFYLAINHLWRSERLTKYKFSVQPRLSFILSSILTLCAIIIAWVVFRAHSIEEARRIIAGIMGLGGVGLDKGKFPYIAKNIGYFFRLFLFSCVILYGPTSQVIITKLTALFGASSNSVMMMKSQNQFQNQMFIVLTATLTSLLFLMSVTMIGRKSEFLYFQF